MSKETPTLKDVAKLAGVAIDTARRALDNHPSTRKNLKKLVDAAAAELGYRPNLVARSLRGRSLWLVPVSISELNSTFFGDLANEIGKELISRQLAPLLCHNHSHLANLCQAVHASVSILANGLNESLVRSFAARQKIVTLNSTLGPIDNVYDIAIDFNTAYCELAAILLEEGRRHYGIFSPVYGVNRRHGWPAQKTALIKECAAAAGMIPLKDGENNIAVNLKEIAALIKAGKRKGQVLFCENDTAAARAAVYLQSLGVSLPDDVRLIGCDGNFLLPGIWTLGIDTVKMASIAVQAVLDMAAGKLSGGTEKVVPAILRDEHEEAKISREIPETAVWGSSRTPL